MANPMAIKRGTSYGVHSVVGEFRECPAGGDPRGVGQVASWPTRKLGETIAEAMEKVGKDGVIAVEESNGLSDEIEYVA